MRQSRINPQSKGFDNFFFQAIRNLVIIVTVLGSITIKGQTKIIPENPNPKPWTDSTALLIEKYGLNNIWQYSKILNISLSDSTWYKNYESVIFNTGFMNAIFQNIHTKNMSDTIISVYPDSILDVFGTKYIQKRKMSVVWDAEGKFDTYHTGCIIRKIVVTDKIQTIGLDSPRVCTNFINKITYMYDKNCSKYPVAFAQAFLEDCSHTISNYYKYVFSYNPSTDYNKNNSSLADVVNLQVNPNPASGQSNITVSFYIPVAGNVTIDIQSAFNLSTQQIFNGNKGVGSYTKNHNINNMSPGTYYVKLTYQGQTFTQIIIIN